METSYYIYIYRKSTYCKKVFFTKKDLRGFAPNPPAGTPSLHPDSPSPGVAGGTEENHFRPLAAIISPYIPSRDGSIF
jgi:hypothetical protein